MKTPFEIAISIVENKTDKPPGWENITAEGIAHALVRGDLNYDQGGNKISQPESSRGNFLYPRVPGSF